MTHAHASARSRHIGLDIELRRAGAPSGAGALGVVECLNARRPLFSSRDKRGLYSPDIPPVHRNLRAANRAPHVHTSTMAGTTSSRRVCTGRWRWHYTYRGCVRRSV